MYVHSFKCTALKMICCFSDHVKALRVDSITTSLFDTFVVPACITYLVILFSQFKWKISLNTFLECSGNKIQYIRIYICIMCL